MYFQYGRFFGVSLGLGYQTAVGNRGLLYDAAFPRVDVRVQYWFDFQFAMDLGIFFASHSFTDTSISNTSRLTNVKLIGYGVDLKYYFDVRDSSAVLSFANPFIVAGVGAMSKTQTTATGLAPSTDSSFTLAAGAGLEFPISHKKTYFVLEGKYNTQNFADSIVQQTGRTDDMSGGFFSLMGHIMFTW